MRSESSTGTSALPRRVESRTRPPSATPTRFASSGFMRSAPARSFRRHSGLRMIVLAVNERRSPAESTNGNSALAPARRPVRERVELVEQLGHRELDAPVRRAQRARSVSSHSSTANTTALLLVEQRVEERVARRRLAGEARARERFRVALRDDLAERPHAGRLREPFGQEIADRAVQQHRRQRDQVRRSPPRARRTCARNALRPSSHAARSCATASAGIAPSASTRRAWSSASENSPGSGGISALRRWK